MTLKNIILNILIIFTVISYTDKCYATSNREERIAIMEGNKLFVERKFKESASKYQEALVANGESAVGRYNLGLAQIKQVTNPQDTTPKTQELLKNARQNLTAVASLAKNKPGLASKANYNLGNLEFNCKEYKNAIEYYKQALRINPKDESARKNLRIAQKNLQNQDQNKNQENNKENQQQDKENKNEQQDKQDKQDNKDQKENNKNQQPEISKQAADQILQAVDNKENQTRAKVQKASKGDKSTGAASARKKW